MIRLITMLTILFLVNACKKKDSNATTPNNIPSVTIGTQLWATKNLDVSRYRNGDIIPQVTDPIQWASLTTGA